MITLETIKLIIDFVSRVPISIYDKPRSNMSYELNSPYYMPGLDKICFSSYSTGTIN
jgi:hypothetical protein